jgi:hypothetical protein
MQVWKMWPRLWKNEGSLFEHAVSETHVPDETYKSVPQHFTVKGARFLGLITRR